LEAACNHFWRISLTEAIETKLVAETFCTHHEFILEKRVRQGNEFLQKPKSTNLILRSTSPVTAFISTYVHLGRSFRMILRIRGSMKHIICGSP
jgi:hypothetical protein